MAATAGSNGSWDPLPLDAAVELFRGAHLRWWVAGGYALELHVGGTWRGHGDTDIGIVRAESERLIDVLGGWDISVAAAGTLTNWDGRPLVADRSENNVWCRRTPSSPWALDVTINDGDDDDWIFRRNRAIRLAWDDAVLRTADGVPYLAPELQLLFKSRDRRAQDELDALTTIPRLDPVRQARLAGWLDAGHPWQRLTGSV